MQDCDIVIVGGGFFGCCLALCLSGVADRIVVLEAEDELMERASRVNQARVHGGFHYPRSFTTALRSRFLQERFAQNFTAAIVSDFTMLYAIAARRSKVSASRFEHTFKAIDAPFAKAPQHLRALFDDKLIEDVFTCREHAFDFAVLRNGLRDRLRKYGVSVMTGAQVETLEEHDDGAAVIFANGDAIRARMVFNVTYANINHILLSSKLATAPLKHELAEIALVRPPPEIEKLGITVMDGPFFSMMPYPHEQLYSLTHVRYTPHYSWSDRAGGKSPYDIARSIPHESRWRHMMQDAARYLPCMTDLEYRKSMFEVKTVMVKNEADDGRPILIHRSNAHSPIVSVMGAKIDNIYDLLEYLPSLDTRFAGVTDKRISE